MSSDALQKREAVRRATMLLRSTAAAALRCAASRTGPPRSRRPAPQPEPPLNLHLHPNRLPCVTRHDDTGVASRDLDYTAADQEMNEAAADVAEDSPRSLHSSTAITHNYTAPFSGVSEQ